MKPIQKPNRGIGTEDALDVGIHRFWKVMMNLNYKIGLLCALFCSVSAFAWSFGEPVWDQAKGAANSIEGEIKSFVSEGTPSITVAVKNDKGEITVERLELCQSFQGGDVNNKLEQGLQDRLREAFNKGEKMRIFYGNVFERCVSQALPARVSTATSL